MFIGFHGKGERKKERKREERTKNKEQRRKYNKQRKERKKKEDGLIFFLKKTILCPSALKQKGANFIKNFNLFWSR